MKYTTPPGVFDIVPHDEKDPWKSSYLWNYVESEIRKITKEYGFQEIRTPIFEKTELFLRSVGEATDIVSKEMYTFKDKGERLLSLRPEGTAPAMRAFIESSLIGRGNVHKLFYIGPMFRYERSQAGRYRQHHQFGVEAIGNDQPEQDVEVIDMIFTLYKRLGLSDLSVCINTLGDEATRAAFRNALKSYLSQYTTELSEDSQKRLEVNPLRILDSKNPADMKILESAPSIHSFLSEESKRHFEKVQENLALLSIPFTVSDKLVRGLDYYNYTVFEIVSGKLGAQNSLVGGGRYDGLIETLGGPKLPSMGFGTGIERIIQTMLAQKVSLPKSNNPLLFIIPLDESAKKTCFKLLHILREHGIQSEMDFSGRKLGKIMNYANQLGATYVTVVGKNELSSGELELKQMHTGEKFKVSLDRLPRILRVESEKDMYMKTWMELMEPFHDDNEKDFFIKQLGSTITETADISHKLEEALKNIKDLI